MLYCMMSNTVYWLYNVGYEYYTHIIYFSQVYTMHTILYNVKHCTVLVVGCPYTQLK